MEMMIIDSHLMKGYELVKDFEKVSKQLDGDVVLSMVATMLDAKFGADSVNEAKKLIKIMIEVNNELGAMKIE